MKAGAQILAGLLDRTVQFLSPIPDDKETELVRQLVGDAHALSAQIVWKDGDLQGLLQRWFKIGREYERDESALEPLPTGVGSSLKDLIAYQIDALFERIASDLEPLCRLFWLWFQWGRAYEKGNAT